MTDPAETMSRSDRMVVVVDTREQAPYAFDPERVTIVRRALPAGDYSLDGHETAIAVERKSIDDYVASVVRGRDRFARELRILAGYDVACVVVEAALDDILARRYRSGAHPNAVFGATLSIIVDRSVPVFFCGDRQIAQRFVEGLLCRYHRKVHGE
jgi:DNA excision repair protein ERCC-4